MRLSFCVAFDALLEFAISGALRALLIQPTLGGLVFESQLTNGGMLSIFLIWALGTQTGIAAVSKRIQPQYPEFTCVEFAGPQLAHPSYPADTDDRVLRIW